MRAQPTQLDLVATPLSHRDGSDRLFVVTGPQPEAADQLKGGPSAVGRRGSGGALRGHHIQGTSTPLLGAADLSR